MRAVAALAGLLAGAVLALTACGGGDNPGVSEGGDLGHGRDLFIQAGCGSCHTMEAAGPQAVGTTGPNLDTAFAASREQDFAESTFQQVVRTQIAFPALDSAMPPDLVTGQDADDVSYFVAQCAGNPTDAQCAPPGGGKITATEGSEIFSQAGCVNCHTLAAAGATGTIGPNLDEAKPTAELATERVTNGGNGMPAFGEQLTDEQIKAVVDYVVQSAGG